MILHRVRNRLQLTTKVILFAAACFGCLSDTAPCAAQSAKSTTYVGPIDGDAKAVRRMAIVVQGNEFVAYACSTDEAFNKTYAVWFKGTTKDGRIQSTLNDVTLDATLKETRFSGTLTAKGTDLLTFRAAAIVRSPIAGLYRATDTVKDSEFIVGWIVDGAHNVVGSCQNKKSGAQQVLKPAKPLPPPPVQQPAPEEVQQQEQVADEVLVVQVDEEAEQQVQAQKVKSVAQVPNGKKVPLPKKKK